jgi:hypothetical protein
VCELADYQPVLADGDPPHAVPVRDAEPVAHADAHLHARHAARGHVHLLERHQLPRGRVRAGGSVRGRGRLAYRGRPHRGCGTRRRSHRTSRTGGRGAAAGAPWAETRRWPRARAPRSSRARARRSPGGGVAAGEEAAASHRRQRAGAA